MVRLTEGRVVVNSHLAVDSQDASIAGLDHRVDFDEGGILVTVGLPQLENSRDDSVLLRVGEPCLAKDLAGFSIVNAVNRVDRHFGESLGALLGEGLDVHATLTRAHRKVATLSTVEQDREVVFLGNVSTFSDHHLVNGVTLDVHTEDGLGAFSRLGRGLSDLYTASLATATHFDLRLDGDDGGTELRCSLGRLLWSLRDDASKYGHAVLLKQVAGLVFIQVHNLSTLRVDRPLTGRGTGRRQLSRLHSTRTFTAKRTQLVVCPPMNRLTTPEARCPPDLTTSSNLIFRSDRRLRQHPLTASPVERTSTPTS